MVNQLNLFPSVGVRFLMAGIMLLALTAIACGGAAPAGQTEPVTVEVTRIVEQPGPEVTREVEVEVTRIVEQPGAAVTREVPVEVTRVVRESAPTDDPGKLIIYSGRSESLVDPIIQQFKGATGIDVQVKYAGTAALAATLLEEGGNSPADVFYAQDPGGLAAVSEMMTELPADIIDLTPKWRVPARAAGWASPAARGSWSMAQTTSPKQICRTTFGDSPSRHGRGA